MKRTLEEVQELFKKFKTLNNEEKDQMIKDLNPPYPDDPVREAKRQKFMQGIAEPVIFEGSYFDD
jgi:hypothetical protein